MQLRLFSDRYARCQACGRDVARLRRVRRFRICDACYDRIVAEPGDVEAMGRFWGWYAEMVRKYPAPGSTRRRARVVSRGVADYWPMCECGRERPIGPFEDPAAQRSLFGPARVGRCPWCESRLAVVRIVQMARTIHPEWDDEEWLDLLWRSHREAFELGVLPELWFELRRRCDDETGEDGEGVVVGSGVDAGRGVYEGR